MAGMVKRADFLENEVVDLTEEIKLVSPTDTPLTTLLMGRGQVVPANDITVTWREKELNSDRGSSTGLSGVVWIDADTHTWQNGVATMSLTVTLKQMMDTKEG